MARIMIHENNLTKHFWAEALNTTCYVQNRIYIRPILEKTTYELFKGRRPKAQRGIFLGYSERSKAYRVYNSETLYVEESMHVKFDDKEPEN